MSGGFNEYENVALKMLQSSGMQGFEEAMANLQFFYQQRKAERQNQALFLGLHLMYLLVNNKKEEFHRLLGSIDAQLREKSPFIQKPILLEQYLSQARYSSSQMVIDEKSLPHQAFAVFLPILRDAIRGEVANNIEQSHERISFKEAAELLFLRDPSEMAAFGRKRNWPIANTEYGQEFHFDHQTGKVSPPTNGEKGQMVDTVRLTKQFMIYAKELEKIV